MDCPPAAELSLETLMQMVAEDQQMQDMDDTDEDAIR
jgi:hypothetical protein